MPTTNRDFWVAKFDANVGRDRKAKEALLAAGWRVAVVWECETRSRSDDSIAVRVREWLSGNEALLEIPTQTALSL